MTLPLEKLQHDVDTWLIQYNEFRPHSGPRCYGKTPLQTFKQSKSIALEKQLDSHHHSSHNNAEPNTTEKTLPDVFLKSDGSVPAEQTQTESLHLQSVQMSEPVNSFHLNDNQSVR